MPAVLEYELEAPVSDEVVDREELSRLAAWLWDMHDAPPPSDELDWFWADEELERHRLSAAYEPDEVLV